MADFKLTTSRIRLSSLGDCAIDVGAIRIGPEAQMRFATLLYLTIERGKRMRRAELTELLWPEVPDPRRRHSLRHVMYVLRLLGVPVAERSQYVELPEAAVDLDYEDLLSQDPTSAPEIRTFLPGYAPTFSSTYCEWVERTRDVIHARLRPFMLARLTTFRTQGKWSEMDHAARQCLQFDPLNEEATLALAEATALGGNKLEAVQILDRFLRDLERGPQEIRIPANVLRRRITERLPAPYLSSAEACFVGREQTLASITHYLRETRLGRGCAFFLWGEAGIGKTRIVLELAKLAALDGITVQRIACQLPDACTPLSISCELARKLLELPGALGCAPASRQCLLNFISQGEVQDSISAHPAGKDHHSLHHSCVRRSLVDLVDAVCDETPLLVIIDDAQFLDRASADIIREIMSRAALHRLFVVATARQLPPVGSALSWPIEGARSLQVLPLSAVDAELLFSAVCSASSCTADIATVRRNMSIAEGNPLFIRELAAQWIDCASAEGLPRLLLDVVDERLGKLDQQSLRVLQACALLGSNSTLGRLERVLEYQRMELLNSLEDLDAHGFLVADGSVIRPKPGLTSEAAVAKLSTTASQYLHGRIGSVLMSDIDVASCDSIVWDCVGHYQRAGEAVRAIELLARCADYALQNGSPTGAVRIWDRACSLDTAHGGLVSMVRSRLISSLRAASMWTRILRAAENRCPRPFDEGAKQEHDDAELGVLEAQWQTCNATTSLLQQAVTCLRDQTASPAHRAEAGVWALIFSHNLPSDGSARSIFETVKSLPMRHTHARHQLVAELVFHTAFGDLTAGAKAGVHLANLSRDGKCLSAMSRALRQAAIPLLYLGEFVAARDLLLEALGAAECVDSTWAVATTTALIARSYFEEGDWTAARDWHARAANQLAAAPEPVRSAIDIPLVGAQIAILEGRLGASDVVGLPPLSHWAEVESPRLQSMTMAIFALRSIKCGEAFLEADAFKAAFLAAGHTGCQDFAAYARSELERVSVGESSARHILRHYIRSSRRERSPLPRFLADSLE